MYTNGFTKAPYQSLVVVTNAQLGYQVYTTREFAEQSEHIVLATARTGESWFREADSAAQPFTGI